MTGINLEDLASKMGFPVRVGLAEAKGQADRIYENGSDPALCGVCGKGDSREVFGQVIIIRYGVCRDCLQKAGETETTRQQRRDDHRLATWKGLYDATDQAVGALTACLICPYCGHTDDLLEEGIQKPMHHTETCFFPALEAALEAAKKE